MGAKRQPEGEDLKSFWFLVTNYLCDAVGILSVERQRKLDMVVELFIKKQSTWREHVERALGVDQGFVRTVYNACLEYDTLKEGAITFLLRGFDCPMVDELIDEFF